MESDHRGDIGFPEAVVGTAAVCIVLMSFLVFCYGTVGDADVHLPSSQTHELMPRDMSYVTGSYTIDEDSVAERVLAADLTGLIIQADPSGIDGVNPSRWTFGEAEGNPSVSRKLIDVDSDDGRRIPTVVTLWVYP